MQLKEVLKQTGLSEKAVRYYEYQNLIQVEKLNGRKVYDEQVMKQLRQIKWLREHECSIQEIRELLKQETMDNMVQEKLKQLDQTIIQLHQKKHDLLELIETKEIPEAKPASKQEINASYMMIVHMDRFMGWLNMILLVFAGVIWSIIQAYEVYLLVMLFLGIVCLFLNKLKFEPKHMENKSYHDCAISFEEVWIRSLMNVTIHSIMIRILIDNINTLLYNLKTDFMFDFLDVCSLCLILFACIALYINILHNFQYQRYFQI